MGPDSERMYTLLGGDNIHWNCCYCDHHGPLGVDNIRWTCCYCGHNGLLDGDNTQCYYCSVCGVFNGDNTTWYESRASHFAAEDLPGKLAAQLSDAALDIRLTEDPLSRDTSENANKTGIIMAFGEIATKSNLANQSVVRNTIKDTGYDGLNQHWQRASNQHQFLIGALYRAVLDFLSSAVQYHGSSGRSSEHHRHKKAIIPLVLATYPSFASATLAPTASEVFHQHVPNIRDFLRIEMGDPFSLASSRAQSFVVWGVFSCAACGLLTLQRSNPYLKYFGFLANGFLMTVCVTVGTEAMLDLFPWTVMGTLLISSLFYMLNSSANEMAGHNLLNRRSNLARLRSDVCESRGDKASEEGLGA